MSKRYLCEGIILFLLPAALLQNRKVVCFCILLAFLSCPALAQKERSSIRKGNKDYEAGKMIEAELNYKRALALLPDSFEGLFNLGNALYQQGKYAEASEIFEKLSLEQVSPAKHSAIYHNLGNSLLKSEKLEESIDAYKKALRINPNDTDTRYNLVYAMQKLRAKQNQQQPQPPTERIMEKILAEEERVQQKIMESEVKSKDMEKDW